MKVLTEDLAARKQPVYFWRWGEAAMLTALGFDPGLASYFRFDDSLLQLIKGIVLTADRQDCPKNLMLDNKLFHNSFLTQLICILTIHIGWLSDPTTKLKEEGIKKIVSYKI